MVNIEENANYLNNSKSKIMKRKYGYYWVNWGVKWVIAEWCYDDEGGEIDEDGYCPGKDFWCWSGMEIIAEPKEVDERQIVRDSILV